jgi:hypothetical protein
MSWKDYQNKENVRSHYWKVTKRVILFVGCAMIVVQGLKLVQHLPSKIAKAAESSSSTPLSNIITDLSLESLQNAPHEVKVYRNGTDWTLQMTFDSENLQKFIYDKLRQYQVDWAGVSVIDSKTGRRQSFSFLFF